ncbi:MerR family transcriptional regulator [Streptomyces sp. NPDC001792]|uniref:MerR family transcriptional regulator n=1 Tax=Streptomyces sp. NPDC001792 TaxID=3154524 RepID=UPI00331CB4AD
MTSNTLDELIDIDAASELAGVKAATIKSWARKDKILLPVDALGERGKNRYRRSDVLAAMQLRGIRPPSEFFQQGALLAAETETHTSGPCQGCAQREDALAKASARIEKLESQVHKFKEIARLAMSAV